MDLITKSININQTRTLSLSTNISEDLNTYINEKNRYKIILVEEGTGFLSINGTIHSFFTATLILLSENDIVELGKCNNLKAYSIYFHPNAINSNLTFDNIKANDSSLSLTEIQDIVLLNQFVSQGSISTIGPITCQHLKQIIFDLHAQLNLQPDGYWPCRARSFLLEIILFIEKFYAKKLFITNQLTSLPSDATNEILLYIFNNLSNKITISTLSKHLGINRNLIQKYVSTATGLSFMAYVSKLRIQLACLLLRDTLVPINEVATRCGYNDLANFGKQFKKSTGLTPSLYRTKIHAKSNDIKNLL